MNLVSSVWAGRIDFQSITADLATDAGSLRGQTTAKYKYLMYHKFWSRGFFYQSGVTIVGIQEAVSGYGTSVQQAYCPVPKSAMVLFDDVIHRQVFREILGAGDCGNLYDPIIFPDSIDEMAACIADEERINGTYRGLDLGSMLNSARNGGYNPDATIKRASSNPTSGYWKPPYDLVVMDMCFDRVSLRRAADSAMIMYSYLKPYIDSGMKLVAFSGEPCLCLDFEKRVYGLDPALNEFSDNKKKVQILDQNRIFAFWETLERL